METTVLPDAMGVDTQFDAIDVFDVQIINTPYVDPVTREAIDLFLECDRIDALPDSAARDNALSELLVRIDIFERTVPQTVKNVVLSTALKMI